MQKKALLALMLAAMMILSGCALITVDEDVDNARIIIDVNGETVNKGTVKSMLDYQIYQNDYTNQMYQMYFGVSAGLSTDAETLLPEIITSYVKNLVAQQKIKELGLDQLTEEEQAEVQANAESEYDALLDQVAAYYLTSEELEGDALKARAKEYAAENGLGDLEYYQESAASNKQFEKLEAYAVKDVAVSEEEVIAAYDEKVAADKEAYAENKDAYISSRDYSTVYYAPAGLRFVKQILVKFTEEDNNAITEKNAAVTAAQTALTTAQTDLDNAGENADLDALNAVLTQAQADLDAATTALNEAKDAAAQNIKEKIDEIYAMATAEGADFDALVAEYNEDTGATEEGYLVGEGVTMYVTPFTEGAMALEEIGAVSQPVLTTYGYHILQYAGDLAEGPVALETVRAGLESEVLTAKQEETYNAAIEAWVAAADVKTYPERMN